MAQKFQSSKRKELFKNCDNIQARCLIVPDMKIRNENSRKFCFGKNKKVIFLVVTVSLLCFSLIKIDVKTGSEAIQDLLEWAAKLNSTEMTVRMLIATSNYDSMIPDKLRYVLDEVGSVRKQIQIYEEMERIPGGPLNFMKTTTERLDKLQGDILLCHIENKLVLSQLVKVYGKLNKDLDTKYSNQKFVNQLNNIAYSLAPFKIFIVGENSDAETEAVQVDPEVLHQILMLMKITLLPLLQKYEDTKILQWRVPLYQTKDKEDPELGPILQKINTFVKKYGHYFERIYLLMFQNLTDICRLREEIKSMDYGMLMDKFKKLQNQVEQDIVSLRERLRSLKYPK